jgi:hypothetical protein
MIVPESVTFVADRIKKDLCCPDGEYPQIETNIHLHTDTDPAKGWVIEMTLRPPHAGMLPLSGTIHRLGGNCSISWDMEIDAIIISGIIKNIPVCVFIIRVNERGFRTSPN